MPNIYFFKISACMLFIFHPVTPRTLSSSSWTWSLTILNASVMFFTEHWRFICYLSLPAAILHSKDLHLLPHHLSSKPTLYSHHFISDLFTYLHPTRWKKVFRGSILWCISKILLSVIRPGKHTFTLSATSPLYIAWIKLRK